MGDTAWWRKSALSTRSAGGGRPDGTYGTDETNVSAFICHTSSLARRNRDASVRRFAASPIRRFALAGSGLAQRDLPDHFGQQVVFGFLDSGV
jgi:hypothetical protein